MGDCASNFQSVYVGVSCLPLLCTCMLIAWCHRARFACKPAFSRRRGDKAHYVYVVRSLWRNEDVVPAQRWAPLLPTITCCRCRHADLTHDTRSVVNGNPSSPLKSTPKANIQS